MKIRPDDLKGSEIRALLEAHLSDMRSVSPPESTHALSIEGLSDPTISVWSGWTDGRLVGCCALKRLDAFHGEVKSMRVATEFRGRGYGAALVAHIIEKARAGGYRRLSLETGSMPFFEPARRLYLRHGFTPCGPFGSYKPDPNSVFMTLSLD